MKGCKRGTFPKLVVWAERKGEQMAGTAGVFIHRNQGWVWMCRCEIVTSTASQGERSGGCLMKLELMDKIRDGRGLPLYRL